MPVVHIAHLSNNIHNKISFLKSYIKYLDNVLKSSKYFADNFKSNITTLLLEDIIVTSHICNCNSQEDLVNI